MAGKLECSGLWNFRVGDLTAALSNSESPIVNAVLRDNIKSTCRVPDGWSRARDMVVPA